MSVAGPTPDAAPAARRLHVHQKVSPFQNVYRVFGDRGGEPGELVAFVKQKRMALREQFTVYADEAGTRPVMTIRANRRIDIQSTMTVTDAVTGQPIGTLAKRGRISLLRSTWELRQAGLPPVTVTERSVVVAVLRRVWGMIPVLGAVPVPWVFHFDGRADGQEVLTHTRLWGVRDRYVLETHSPALDWRLAIAMAICLDAMQKR